MRVYKFVNPNDAKVVIAALETWNTVVSDDNDEVAAANVIPFASNSFTNSIITAQPVSQDFIDFLSDFAEKQQDDEPNDEIAGANRVRDEKMLRETFSE